MNVVLLCGSHPRHAHLADRLAGAGQLAGLVVEGREQLTPAPPEGLSAGDRANWERHFGGRDEAEQRTFTAPLPQVPTLRIERPELNSDEVRSFVVGLHPDVVVTYGVHLLHDATLEAFGAVAERCWNLHGGLSPWYRGTATLFWPFYLLEPQWAGVTIHRLVASADAGPIVHQVTPELTSGDGVHDVGVRAVVRGCDDLVRLIQVLESGGQVEEHPQRPAGRLFRARDFRPEHLRVVYDLFDDQIVDRYLDGTLGGKAPTLVDGFAPMAASGGAA